MRRWWRWEARAEVGTDSSRYSLWTTLAEDSGSCCSSPAAYSDPDLDLGVDRNLDPDPRLALTDCAPLASVARILAGAAVGVAVGRGPEGVGGARGDGRAVGEGGVPVTPAAADPADLCPCNRPGNYDPAQIFLQGRDSLGIAGGTEGYLQRRLVGEAFGIDWDLHDWDPFDWDPFG
jgi:hypothetical protein